MKSTVLKKGSVIAAATLLLLICVLGLIEFKSKQTNAGYSSRKWYQQSITSLDQKAQQLCISLAQHQSSAQIQQVFKETRAAYKQTEVMLEYYNPYAAQVLNGPASKKEPADFQQLETALFPVTDTQAAYIAARQLASVTHNLTLKDKLPAPTDAQLFDAMRLELVRVLALGLSGFDSPSAQNSLPEASASLQGVENLWKIYAPQVSLHNRALAKYTNELLSNAHSALASQTFDRDRFVRDYINQLSVNLKLSREALNIPYNEQPSIFDPASSSVFAKNAIHPLYYSEDTSNGSAQDPVYEINGQRLKASYIQSLLQENSAFNSYAGE
jgi:hypothetical protein